MAKEKSAAQIYREELHAAIADCNEVQKWEPPIPLDLDTDASEEELRGCAEEYNPEKDKLKESTLRIFEDLTGKKFLPEAPAETPAEEPAKKTRGKKSKTEEVPPPPAEEPTPPAEEQPAQKKGRGKKAKEEAPPAETKAPVEEPAQTQTEPEPPASEPEQPQGATKPRKERTKLPPKRTTPKRRVPIEFRKYTRGIAILEALQRQPCTKNELIASADAIYIERGGAGNLIASGTMYSTVVPVLEVMGLVVQDPDTGKWHIQDYEVITDE